MPNTQSSHAVSPRSGQSIRTAEENPLETPVQFVRGVGPKRAELLARLGIQTVDDLLLYVPRDVLDLTEVRPAQKLTENRVQTVRGTVVDLDGRQISGGRTLVCALLDCGGEYVRGNWFNQAWMLKKFRPGETVLFSGKPKRKSGRWEFSHPNVQWIDEDDPHAHGGIILRYGLTDGLKLQDIRRIIRNAVEDYTQFVPDHLPEAFRLSHQLPGIREAIRLLHLPTKIQQYHSSRRRLIFDDLLEFQLGLAMKRRAWKRKDNAPCLPVTAKIDSRIRRLFPFDFTGGQSDAVREICADLNSKKAMHRLLQADVGAGKTAVAVYAILVAIAAGYQAVLMAPTEVLASQHWATIDRMLSHSRVKRLQLTGNLTAAGRRQALEEIKRGDVQLIVGTQAVIQDDVDFHKLGLVIIDEQHKFGVMQRARFSVGDFSPHVLVMTATPIPRSLCLTQFGDLDVTTITEMPPGRQRVITSRVSGEAVKKRSWKFVREQLQKGRQAFIVCPRIESGSTQENRKSDLGAEEVYRRLIQSELKELRVGLVHGQMDRQKKLEAMQAFRNGETQILVATTVVEVGVDIPNATLMIILQAERFGLSQLHQLRGRISRGKYQGYCFLFSESDSADAVGRLSALESSSDGFKIAEVDFELRGPGDILGTRQHGELPLKVADLRRDHEILLQAREAAFELVESGEFDKAEFAPLKIRVLERFGHLMDLPQSG
ncbi:MAG: ATP-dependent DNA helicase RecG [Planctomycetes bacterium]|nr:ATP-dependent DNA helicase RecG [Planctomycetota bacterium]